LLVDEYKEISGLLTTIPKAIYVYPWKRELLTVRKDIYEQLPDPWTVQDLTSLLANQKNSVYQMYEQFWQEIAEHRAKNKPVKLLINNKDIQIVREEFSKYGINSIVKMPKSINYVIQEMEVTR